MAGERVSERCLCGALSFEAPGLAEETGARHSGRRRKLGGGVCIAAPLSQISIEDESAPGRPPSSGCGERSFCTTCGSVLFRRMRDGAVTMVSLQAFDDQSDFESADEILVDDKPARYAFAIDARKLAGEEFFARAMASQESSNG